MNTYLIAILAVLIPWGLAACPMPDQYADILQPSVDAAGSGFDTNGYLQVYVDASTVQTRSDLRFTMGVCNILAVKSIVGPDPICTERYMLNLSWSDWKLCGMYKNPFTSTPQEDHYWGLLKIIFDEKAGEIAGEIFYRTVTNEAKLSVTLQREVQAVSELVRIYAPADVDTALLDVTVKFYESFPGRIDFSVITGVQQPFRLNLYQVLTYPPIEAFPWFINPIPIWTESDPQGYRQEWITSLFTAGCRVCKLDGQHLVLNFTLSCQGLSDPSLCPIHSLHTVGMEVKIYTSDWCDKFVGDAKLDASMDSYTNGGFLVTTNAFFLNENAWFMAKITSTAGLDFSAVQILWVNCSGNAVIGGWRMVSALPSFHSNLLIPAKPKFWFLLDDAYFQAADRSWNQMVCKARFRVTYAAKKREDAPAELEMEQAFQLKDGRAGAASTLTPWAFLSL